MSEQETTVIPFVDLARQQKRIRKHILRGVKDVLNHGKYIMGSEVKTLEEKLAEYVGVKHCICTSSGTDALFIALIAKGIQPGNEVITTPFTFIATVESIVRAGARPVFVDIDPDTYNIDASKIEAKITPKTRAVMAVSLFGQCPDFDALQKICRKYKLALIEDAAQSFGAEYNGKRSCSIADISCTSFFPAKPLGGYGDGGACFTDDELLASVLREVINHGQNSKYSYTRHGINGRLDTLQAAILIEKLKVFPDEIKKRIKIAGRYTQALKNHVKTPFVSEYNKSIYSQYTIETEHQSEVQKKMKMRGIPTTVYYPKPLYVQPIFSNGDMNTRLKHTDRACKRVLSLPMCSYLTQKNQDYVIRSLIEVLENIS